MKTGLKAVRLITLPKFANRGGSLAVAEGGQSVPFEVRRVYYLYDIQNGARRGGHAHKANEQVLVAVTGGFDIVLDDGVSRQTFRLNEPNVGLYCSTMVWLELNGFAPGTVCLVMASQYYDAQDYIRDYETFLNAVRASAVR